MNETKEILSLIYQKVSALEEKPVLQRVYFTFNEACEYMGVKSNVLYRMMREREITYSKPNNKQIFFKKEDMDAYLSRNTVPSFSSLEGLASDYMLNAQSAQ